MLTHVDRVLATLAALLLFTWHEVHLFNSRPNEPDPARGYILANATHVFGGSQSLYLSQADVALRWGLAGAVLVVAVWAISHTFRRTAR